LRGALGGVDGFLVRLLEGVWGDGEGSAFFDGVLGLKFDSDSVGENHPDDKDDAEVVDFFDGVPGSKSDPESDNENHPDDEDDEDDEDEDDEDDEDDDDENDEDEDEDDEEDEEDEDELSGAGRFGAALRGALGGVDLLVVRLLEGVLGDGEVFAFFDGVLGASSSSSSFPSSLSSSLNETLFLSQRFLLLPPLENESPERLTFGVFPFSSSIRYSVIAVS
jgi:hypothetical protein